MKVRSGFVSNSSSSSFVVVAPKNDFDKVYNESDKYTQQVIEELGYSTRQFAGMDVITIAGMTGNYSSFEYMSIDIDEEDEDKFKDWYMFEELYNEFEAKLKNRGALAMSVDC